jgi:oligoendopeptidase F
MKGRNDMSKWNLSQFYSDDDAWKKDLDRLPGLIDELAAFKGTLSDPAAFKAFHHKEEEVTMVFYRVFGYIHLKSDLDLKDTDTSAKNQKALLLLSELNQKTSFVAPELIGIGQDKVLAMTEADDFLKTYRFPMEKLFFQQKHVLDDKSESLLSNYAPIRNIPTSLYQSLAIIDAEDEDVTLSTGKTVRVTQSNFRSLLSTLESAEDRKLVFEAAFRRYKDNKAAFAATYNLVLQQLRANVKSRGYASALDAALFRNNIPTDVFHNLKDVAFENTAPVKRYIELRKKHFKLDTYHTYDRFMKLAKDDTEYTYDDAKALFFKSIEGMDEAFVDKQKDAIADGFVDVEPGVGKRTGAYSSGFYGFHPHILLNHDKTLDSVFTLAHEAGHSAHTLFSNENQPMATSDYTIFVAEIASTFNEHVLLDHLLTTARTKAQRIALLEKAIDGIMATFFRQTLFATYEFRANQLVEQGVPITERALSEIMKDLYMHYYDIDIESEVYKPYVWAYIPHLFHTPFYVYQYATSYAASLSIHAAVTKGVPGAMENYLGLLKSGGSDYPVNQAAKAGADLNDKKTFMAVIDRFNMLLDQLEEALA